MTGRKQPERVAHHCRQTMGRTQRSAFASRCPKICTMRSVGSAVMLVEQISSRQACCSLRGSACRFRAPRRRSRQCSSLLLIFLCRRGRPVGGVPEDPATISQWLGNCAPATDMNLAHARHRGKVQDFSGPLQA